MSIFKKVLSAIFGSGRANPIKVIIVGLDAAGKTTILYKLRGFGDEVTTTIPTIGFNVETLDRKDINMTCWDVGGCDKIRPLWRYYYQDMSLLMFVVDSNDRERLPNASEELDSFLSDTSVPANTPVLIMANKQDLPNAMYVSEIAEKLQLHSKLRGRQWYVCPSCAVTSHGISEAVQWMKHAVENKNAYAVSATTGATSVAPHAVVVDATAVDSSPNKAVDEVATAKALEREVTRRTTLEEWYRRSLQEQADAVETLGSVKAANDAFLSRVSDASLESWDHFTHIKLGYLVLTGKMCSGFEEATQRVCELIERYIARSSRTSGRSYHCTMTHFWCHMIAVQLAHLTVVADSSDGSEGGGASLVSFMESLQSFEAVDLWDGKLFSRYYSNPVMFGADARRQYVSPDLKPLPSV